MINKKSQQRSEPTKEEIEKAYSEFLFDTENKERYLMELGMTRETARIIINLEYNAAIYPLEILLKAEENFLKDNNLKQFLFKYGCGCLGTNPKTMIEKYKKLLKYSIAKARLNPIGEIKYLIPEKTIWQKISIFFDLERLKKRFKL